MTLNNIDKINRAAKMANEKAALARTSMQRIEVILTNELQQDQKLVSGFSAASTLIQEVEKRHARNRTLYKRRQTCSLRFLGSLMLRWPS